jgi:hypothetical protein
VIEEPMQEILLSVRDLSTVTDLHHRFSLLNLF